MREFIYRNNKYGYMEKYEKTPYATCVENHVNGLLDFIYDIGGQKIDFCVFDWKSNKRPAKSDYEKLFGKPKKESQLPFDSAVYMFYWSDKDEFLKIGMVSSGSGNRFYNQHYQPSGAKSCLARSILDSPEECLYYDDFASINMRIDNWIIQHLRRIDIIFPTDERAFISEAVESYFHAVCNPVFEGKVCKTAKAQGVRFKNGLWASCPLQRSPEEHI